MNESAAGGFDGALLPRPAGNPARCGNGGFFCRGADLRPPCPEIGPGGAGVCGRCLLSEAFDPGGFAAAFPGGGSGTGRGIWFGKGSEIEERRNSWISVMPF